MGQINTAELMQILKTKPNVTSVKIENLTAGPGIPMKKGIVVKLNRATAEPGFAPPQIYNIINTYGKNHIVILEALDHTTEDFYGDNHKSKAFASIKTNVIIANKGKSGWWISKMKKKPTFKEDSLKNHFKLKKNETLTIKMIDTELQKLKKKYPNGGYSKPDLKLVRRLNAAKNMMNITQKKKDLY